MKKFKQFKSEQQHITEVGPYASAMMGAMGIIGLGMAGFKLFKSAKEKIKGYRETKAEKKANRESGVEIEVKKINPETGEEYEELVPLSGSDANLDADGVEKKRKELQKKYDNMEKGKDKAAANVKIRAELGKGPNDIITKDDKKKGMDLLKKAQEPEPEPDEPDEPEEAPTDEPEDKVERDKDGNLKNQDDAEAAYKASNFTKAPAGWQKDPDDEKKVVKRGEKKKKATGQGQEAGKKTLGVVDKDKQAALLQRLKDKKANSTKEEFLIFAKTELSSLTEEDRTKILEDLVLEEVITLTESKELQTIVETKSKLLNFGEFISEGVMSDLLKATKSKKDSEITLDDGADIPIDPLTSQILVKYIEGLSSSEKNRTIQQIQRTERAFMKVLGKAHENI
jgi:hypothetical protein